MTSFRDFRSAAALAVAGLGMLAASWAVAHDPAPDARRGGEKTVVLQKQGLKDLPGKQARMVTVDYAPGQASIPHVHPGSVFAYVLEGEVVSQLEGGGEVTYRAGESWYEPPEVPHLVSRNASPTRPARLLAVLITGENEQLKRSLPDR
ncbi:cupin domain-containing protein [Noviherbaspirillum sp.]|uniref:cupin domain-containing protein n=1 Tax=Noviherbaspirillum sp. TaxID=1926288 RepID=UPI002D6AF5FD|nr:cupin domain-containing protein [Noviherbaspirillum sp.]HZW20844.1 cupin domain-containing protein [Noviherbaspirillum sp.]